MLAEAPKGKGDLRTQLEKIMRPGRGTATLLPSLSTLVAKKTSLKGDSSDMVRKAATRAVEVIN